MIRPEEYLYHLPLAQQAYDQAKSRVESIIEKKYEYVRSVFSEDLTKIDTVKAEFRIKKAKAEEEFIRAIIAYMTAFDELAKLNALNADVWKAEAGVWHDAYISSIQENIEFSKVILKKNVEKVYKHA
jgi:hypothetical protein